MKKLFLAFLLLTALSRVEADDSILENSDFSDGITHWHGDCRTPADMISVDSSYPGSPTDNGMVIQLRSSEWSKVTQDFMTKPGTFDLQLIYTVSPGIQFSTRAEDYANVPASIGFNDWKAFSSEPGTWVMMLCDIAAGHSTYFKIAPNLAATGPQGLHATFSGLRSDERKTICVAFPPGQGFITFKKISLSSNSSEKP